MLMMSILLEIHQWIPARIHAIVRCRSSEHLHIIQPRGGSDADDPYPILCRRNNSGSMRAWPFPSVGVSPGTKLTAPFTFDARSGCRASMPVSRMATLIPLPGSVPCLRRTDLRHACGNRLGVRRLHQLGHPLEPGRARPLPLPRYLRRSAGARSPAWYVENKDGSLVEIDIQDVVGVLTILRASSTLSLLWSLRRSLRWNVTMMACFSSAVVIVLPLSTPGRRLVNSASPGMPIYGFNAMAGAGTSITAA